MRTGLPVSAKQFSGLPADKPISSSSPLMGQPMEPGALITSAATSFPGRRSRYVHPLATPPASRPYLQLS
jgi:hypothetical protein